MNKTKLPNGLMAYGHSKQETRLIYGQVLDYFRNEVKLHPGMTIFDVGSNTGLFALEVLYQTQGNANLYCFEPAPQNFALLERNVKEQFPDSPVKLFPCGLSSTPRTTTFYYRPHSSAMSSLQATASLPDKDRTIALLRDPQLPDYYLNPKFRWLKFLPKPVLSVMIEQYRKRLERVIPIQCELQTLSQIIADENITHIDLLKLDVEDEELAVLQGIEAQDWDKVQAVAIEVHDTNKRLNSIQRLLEDNQFSNIVVDQEFVFKGTEIYGIYATRQAAN